MASRSHLSIGEVLSLLREEFPDVTISKIRFLESQGLVDPERTPSGYRKFYEADVERLRWILLQQKEHFLPLKVIKDRLESSDPAGDPPAAPDVPRSDGRSDPLHEGGLAADESRKVVVDGPASTPPRPAIFAGLHSFSSSSNGPAGDGSAAPGGDEEEGRDPAENVQSSYTEAELAAAAGCTTRLVADLAQFGLVGPLDQAGGTPYYYRCAVEICRAASRFAAFGVEPRHLRVWRNAAVKEVELFAQLVTPLLRQRNPKGRSEAEDALNELAAAGAQLRAALVEREISSIR